MLNKSYAQCFGQSILHGFCHLVWYKGIWGGSLNISMVSRPSQYLRVGIARILIVLPFFSKSRCWCSLFGFFCLFVCLFVCLLFMQISPPLHLWWPPAKPSWTHDNGLLIFLSYYWRLLSLRPKASLFATPNDVDNSNLQPKLMDRGFPNDTVKRHSIWDHHRIRNQICRLAPVLKTIFHQCVISYTCSS